MKKTIRLKAEYDYNFHLLGIISKVKEYTLSWGINHAVGIDLKKEEDLEVGLKKGVKLKISNYSYQTENCGFYLIKNKLEEEIEGEQVIFAPSLKTFDYILKVESDDDSAPINEIYNAVRTADQVQSVLKLDVNKIKEKEYFLL